MSRHWRAILVGAFALAAAAAGCEQAPMPGRTASPTLDVPFEPTAQHVVAEMLELAQVGENDLGCGDGRIVIAAVEEFGARGVCVDRSAAHLREPRECSRPAPPSASSSEPHHSKAGCRGGRGSKV